MPTRFYLPIDTTAPAITPTPHAEWDNIASFSRYRMTTVQRGITAITTASVTDSTATADRDVLMAQYVSRPLKAQTIAGTVKGRVRALENNANNNLRSQCIIWIAAPDGSTRHVLYAGDTTTGTGNPTSEWNAATAQNRQMPRGSSQSLTSGDAEDGDYLVVEIGYRKHAAASTQGTIRLGDTNTGSPYDLAEDESGSSDYNPWIEFSQELIPVTTFAGTRLWLPSTGATDISPAFAAAWEFAGSGDRIKAVTSKINSSFATKAQAETAGNHNGQDIMLRQYVSAALDGNQTIAGAVHGQVRLQESNASADYSPQMIMRVIQANGSSVRGTPYSGHALGAGNEIATSLTNAVTPRKTASTYNNVFLTSVNALSTDFVVIELGARIHGSTGGFTLTGDFGDNASSDLPWDDSATTQLNPWLDFGSDLVFVSNPAIMRRAHMVQ